MKDKSRDSILHNDFVPLRSGGREPKDEEKLPRFATQGIGAAVEQLEKGEA